MTTPSAAAQKCLTESDQHALAQREIVCQKCDANKKLIETAYNACVERNKPASTILDKVELDIGIATLSFGLGALFVGSHCLGLCK